MDSSDSFQSLNSIWKLGHAFFLKCWTFTNGSCSSAGEVLLLCSYDLIPLINCFMNGISYQGPKHPRHVVITRR